MTKEECFGYGGLKQKNMSSALVVLGTLHCAALGHLSLSPAMGNASAPEEVHYLDREPILASAWNEMILRCLAGSKARQGRAMMFYLIDPRKIPIERHINVRSGANPVDPHWPGYFESRKKLKKAYDNR